MLKVSSLHLKWMTWVVLFIFPILGMAIDLVSPSLPAIAKELHISSSAAQNIISFYLLGYAGGNFMGGLLADSLGRRKLLLGGLFGFVLASVLPVLFPHIMALFIARFLQGLTLGFVSVVSRAVFSDIIPKEKFIKFGVLLGTMFGIGPVIGPFIGGYLQYYLGWESCFIFFAVIIAVEFVLVFFIVPETHTTRQAFCVKTVKNNIKEVIAHREFIGVVFMMGTVYSLIISFNVLGPFIIQAQLHYSPVFFGYVALAMGVAFMLATFVCRYLLSKCTAQRLFFLFTRVAAVVALLGLIGSYFFSQSVVFFSCVSAFMFFTSGFIFPMSMGHGLSFFRHIAGTATATMFLVNISMTSITGFVLSFLEIHSIITAMWVYFIFIILALVIYSTRVQKCRTTF